MNDIDNGLSDSGAQPGTEQSTLARNADGLGENPTESSTETSAQTAETSSLTPPRWSFIFQYFVPSRLPGVVPSLLFGPQRAPPAPTTRSRAEGPRARPSAGVEAQGSESDNESLPELIPSSASEQSTAQGSPASSEPGSTRARASRPPGLSIVPPQADEDTFMRAASPLPSAGGNNGSAGTPPNTAIPPTTPTFHLPNAVNMAVSASGFPVFFHPAVGPFVVISRASEPGTQVDSLATPTMQAGVGDQPTVTYHLTPLSALPPDLLSQLFPNGLAFFPFFHGNMPGPGMGNWESDRGRPPTASMDTIRKLPVMRYITRKLWDRNRSCTVCFEDLPSGLVPPPPATDSPIDKVIVKLPCSHLFHLPCVQPWLTGQSNACPACRYELPTGDAAFDRGVKERMALWKIDAEPEGAEDEVVYEMLGQGRGTAAELFGASDDGCACEMRKVVGRCLRSPAAEISVEKELATAESISAESQITGTSMIDAWNGSLREVTGCGHRFHAECLASLLNVRGYPMPMTKEEQVRCPVCRKLGSVIEVSEVGVDTVMEDQDDFETRKRKADAGWISGAEQVQCGPKGVDLASDRTTIEDLD